MIKTYEDRLAALRLLGIANGFAASWWSDEDLNRALTCGVREMPEIPTYFMGLPSQPFQMRGAMRNYTAIEILPADF